MKHDYQKLKIWQEARKLTKEIYIVSSDFPKSENYGLKNQIRRASVSIVSNIAEGSGYESDAQFLKYLFISLGSLCEVETQCFLSNDLEYLSDQKLDLLIQNTDELKRMLLSFISKLKKDNRFNPKFILLLIFYSLIAM
ncbi:MAG: four helix bundle protein [Saprospiraceae bacterium]|nr:four helix bundle protein [Saprospiraceae bacterium]